MAKLGEFVSLQVAKDRIIDPKIKLVEETYCGAGKNAKFIHEEYGEFWSTPGRVWKGGLGIFGKIINGTKRAINVEVIKKRLPDFISIDEKTYKCVRKIARFIDKEYGEFWGVVNDVLRFKRHRKRDINERRKGIKYTAKDIQGMIPKHIKIVKDTFVNVTTKAKFIDKKYGDFWCCPNKIISGKSTGHKKRWIEKRKKTCILKYGYEHAMQNKDIYVKNLKSRANVFYVQHWKTGEHLYCQANYEKSVVEWLNKNKIDFHWQIPFELDCGTYYCDLYLKQDNKYIEIKGWFNTEFRKKKWEEFHKKYPNSELWMKKELKDKGILITKKKI